MDTSSWYVKYLSHNKCCSVSGNDSSIYLVVVMVIVASVAYYCCGSLCSIILKLYVFLKCKTERKNFSLLPSFRNR
jgi:hypothetical protein